MKTTIYELLGMIKDGKAPKKIKYGNCIYKYDKELADYKNEDDMDLFDDTINTFMLNDEVEILDEPKENKIEYLDNVYKDDRFGYSIDVGKIQSKINEIIDKLNKEE